jgi:hypothetical protein
MFINDKKLIAFMLTALKENTYPDHIDIAHIALEYTTFELPSYDEMEEISRNLDNYIDTSLRIQQLDKHGNIIDEFTSEEFQDDLINDGLSVEDKLRNLARLVRLMQEVDDRNHTKVYTDAVSLIASFHSGYEEDEHGNIELPGPISDFVSNSRDKELWKEYCDKHTTNTDNHYQSQEAIDEQ